MNQNSREKISIRELSFGYSRGKADVLSSLSFELKPGHITVMMGPSGCGKSTLLRILMGLETGARGELSHATATNKFSNWNASQEFFGLVPQVPHLFPWKTVFENIALALPTSLTKDQIQQRVDEVLAVVQLSEASDKYPGEISQGMASRVSFARTLVQDIKAILLDEPFAALDAMTRLHLQNWTREKVRNANLPGLFVTHDIHEAVLLGDEIHILGGHPARIAASFGRGKVTPETLVHHISMRGTSL